MPIQLWKCCGKQYTQGVKACKVCNAPRKSYGVLPDHKPAERDKTPTIAQRTPKKRRTRDPHIRPDGEQIHVSTLVMKNGDTLEDIKIKRSRGLDDT
jgi:hypothetical protein